jgi:hypothetical protein
MLPFRDRIHVGVDATSVCAAPHTATIAMFTFAAILLRMRAKRRSPCLFGVSCVAICAAFNLPAPSPLSRLGNFHTLAAE